MCHRADPQYLVENAITWRRRVSWQGRSWHGADVPQHCREGLF